MKPVLHLLAAALLPLAAAIAETAVFENFTLIDTRAAAARPAMALIVTDGRVAWVGPQAKLKAPAGAARVSLAGKFVMPGIINLHGHIGNTVDFVQDPKNFTRANVEKQLRMYSTYGVTTMVTMGSEQELALGVRSDQRATGRPKMARLYAAYRGFTGKDGYPTSAPGMKGVPFEVQTVDEVKKDVAILADKRADLVKIWVDDHLGKEKKIPMDLSKAIIEEASRKGLKVAAHIFYLDDAKQLVDAGLYGLAHSVRDKPVDAALIASMKKKGAWLAAPTLAREASTFVFARPTPMLDDPFFQRAISPQMLATLKSAEFQKRAQGEPDTAHGRDWLEMAKKNLKTMVDAGVKTGFGTDSGPPRRIQGYNEHWEMEMMADSGLTAGQILRMATVNAAEFLNAKDLGSLEAGKWADLIVLRANPFDNIKNTRTIDAVYVGGDRADSNRQ